MSRKETIMLQLIEGHEEFVDKLKQPTKEKCIPLLKTNKVTSLLEHYFNYKNDSLLEVSLTSELDDVKKGHILADTTTLNGIFAKHYAVLFGRPFTHIPSVPIFDSTECQIQSKGYATSYTIFLPPDIQHAGYWKTSIEKVLKCKNSTPTSFGYIHYMPLDELCIYLTRCIARLTNFEKADSIFDLTVITSDQPLKDSSDKVMSYLESNIPYTVLHHSRPHCSRIKCSDENVILCGSPTKGRQGKCFNGYECSWKNSKKVFMGELKTSLLFLNGCSTGRFGQTSYGIPTNSMLSYTCTTGNVVNYIGNSHVGRYYESDSDWLEILLTLKMKPSRAVTLVNELRRIENRQLEETCTFFGDAEMLISNINSSTTFIYVQYNNETTIQWEDNNLFLCVMAYGDTLANLCKNDLLEITIPEAKGVFNILYGNFIYNPFANYSLGLFKKKGKGKSCNSFTIIIKTLESIKTFQLGARMLELIANLNAYKSSDLYKKVLQLVDLRELEDRQILFQKHLNSKINIVNKYWVLDNLVDAENELIQKVNEQIVREALDLGRNGLWFWDEKYLDSFLVDLGKEDVPQLKCKTCGDASYVETLISYLNANIRRESEICSSCGTVRDLPVSECECAFASNESECNEKSFSDSFYLKNTSGSELQITYALAIIGFRPTNFKSMPMSTVIEAGETKTIDSYITYEEKPSGLYWIRLYLSYNGSFGFISKLVFFH